MNFFPLPQGQESFRPIDMGGRMPLLPESRWPQGQIVKPAASKWRSKVKALAIRCRVIRANEMQSVKLTC